jgi:hypothetical protein
VVVPPSHGAGPHNTFTERHGCLETIIFPLLFEFLADKRSMHLGFFSLSFPLKISASRLNLI